MPHSPALIAHIVHRFDTGGLENGVVNLINHLPAERFRHAVVALTEVAPAFARRVTAQGVTMHALHKGPGHGLALYPALYRLLRQLRPAVVHTRNLAALEMQPVAWAAGVPVRVHGEHGRDVEDLDGSSRKLQRVRRLYAPFVQRYVALSADLASYLTDRVGIDPRRVTQIYNGVDAERFRPRRNGDLPPSGWPFDPTRHWVVGTVGRMQTVKNQTLLAQAVVRAVSLQPALRDRLRLAMVGDGPLQSACRGLLADAGLESLAWLPGERSDVADVMRALDCFALPSLAEGISNTILEAMACGLPVVATDVGGNAELVTAGRTGVIVPSGDVEATAQALLRLTADQAFARSAGEAGRAEVERRFSLGAMVAAYQDVYDRQLAAAGVARQGD